MKFLRRVLIAVVVAVGVVVLAIAPFLVMTPRAPAQPGEVTTPAELDAYLEALVANETPPAIEVTVLKDGEAVYSKAFGKSDVNGKTAAPDDVFHFWSVTKLFTATAVMQLAEDGKLSLDDPVTRHVPDFKTTNKSGAPAYITIRQLLDHTSGMKDLGPGDLLGWIHHLTDPPVDQASIVRDRMAAYKSLAGTPGKTGSYTNAGYIVLGAVVQAASGMTYEDFVRTRLLTPLGMTSTDFTYRDDHLPRAVAGTHPFFQMFTPLLLVIHRDWFSSWVDKTARNRMWLAPIYTDYTPPTGLIGTGADLARFGEAILEGGALDGQRVLSDANVAAMLDEGYGDNTGPDRDRMGLGWHWWNDAPIPFKGHGGEGPGFSAQLAVFQDQKMVVVILTNDTLTDRLALTKLVAAVFR